MSWIKTDEYLPGNDRLIQIYGEVDDMRVGVKQLFIGQFVNSNFYSLLPQSNNLKNVTHWAEMLETPEDL